MHSPPRIRQPRAVLLFLSLFFILLAGCSTLRETYREPKQFEVQNLMNEQGLTLLADTTVEVNKILLVKDDNNFGYYVTTVREPEEELVYSNIMTNLSDAPLIYIAVASGDPYIAGVLIQDETILESADAVMLTMSDGTEIEHPLSEQGSAILKGSPEQGSHLISISVLDSGGSEIYNFQP